MTHRHKRDHITLRPMMPEGKPVDIPPLLSFTDIGVAVSTTITVAGLLYPHFTLTLTTIFTVMWASVTLNLMMFLSFIKMVRAVDRQMMSSFYETTSQLGRHHASLADTVVKHLTEHARELRDKETAQGKDPRKTTH